MLVSQSQATNPGGFSLIPLLLLVDSSCLALSVASSPLLLPPPWFRFSSLLEWIIIVSPHCFPCLQSAPCLSNLHSASINLPHVTPQPEVIVCPIAFTVKFRLLSLAYRAGWYHSAALCFLSLLLFHPLPSVKPAGPTTLLHSLCLHMHVALCLKYSPFLFV